MSEKFEIKLATIEDIEDVFELSNDPLVRANSFNQAKILWKEHQEWFKNKLNDENNIFYIVKNMENSFISQVRFEKINNEEGDISISIKSLFRGKGYGVEILKDVSEKIINEQNIKKINAYIKKTNKSSQKAFENAGYILKTDYNEKMRYEYNVK